MKTLTILLTIIAAVTFSGCTSSRTIWVPYDSVSVVVERSHGNKDGLAVRVGGIETNMDSRTALSFLSEFYSSHEGRPPPMVLDLNTKLAIMDGCPDGNFFDAVQRLAKQWNFDLYIQRLPLSQAPNVDTAIYELWNTRENSNQKLKATVDTAP